MNFLLNRSHEEREDEEVFVSQEGVHRAVGAEIVNNVLNGVSASCFAYGHTGEERVEEKMTERVRCGTAFMLT